jgi:hypothetical protein
MHKGPVFQRKWPHILPSGQLYPQRVFYPCISIILLRQAVWPPLICKILCRKTKWEEKSKNFGMVYRWLLWDRQFWLCWILFPGIVVCSAGNAGIRHAAPQLVHYSVK